jgi:hypothetical protein
MKQPEGFHIGFPNKVCRLRKSLYGLKQSARQENKKLHSVLTELSFKRIESDRSVYIYSNGEVHIIVPIYIDDITIASKSSSAIDKYVHLLSHHFKCRDLGLTRFLLGVSVERGRSTCTLKLHQTGNGPRPLDCAVAAELLTPLLSKSTCWLGTHRPLVLRVFDAFGLLPPWEFTPCHQSPLLSSPTSFSSSCIPINSG